MATGINWNSMPENQRTLKKSFKLDLIQAIAYTYTSGHLCQFDVVNSWVL